MEHAIFDSTHCAIGLLGGALISTPLFHPRSFGAMRDSHSREKAVVPTENE
jgi:hypothetical protein